MKKKWWIAITVILVLALAVPAYAAITDTQKKELLDLHKQMIELRKKMVDIYVESGQITSDQGKAIKDRMDQMEKYREENGILPGPGMMGGGGCGGPGFGGKAGFGKRGGFGGPMMGGWGWGGAQTQSL